MTSALVALLAFATLGRAHMSIWTESMYGIGHNGPGTPYFVGEGPTMNISFEAGIPTDPIGPGLTTQDAWWFRGPAYRALTPVPGAVSSLPAGGTWTVDITCHPAWSSLGWRTTDPNDIYSACPDSPGPYHADPEALSIIPDLIQGCALAIADVDDIEKVTRDNLAIFSVQPHCVAQRINTFDIPAQMPACTGSKCICAWLWQPATGIGNFYMTAFDCQVTNAIPNTPKISTNLSDPVWCPPEDRPCPPQLGAKRPIYFYNSDPNVEWIGNDDRPGYLPHWGYTPGAQVDIFATKTASSSILSATSTVTRSTVATATSTVTSAPSVIVGTPVVTKAAPTSTSTSTSTVANRRTKAMPTAGARRTKAMPGSLQATAVAGKQKREHPRHFTKPTEDEEEEQQQEVESTPTTEPDVAVPYDSDEETKVQDGILRWIRSLPRDPMRDEILARALYYDDNVARDVIQNLGKRSRFEIIQDDWTVGDSHVVPAQKLAAAGLFE